MRTLNKYSIIAIILVLSFSSISVRAQELFGAGSLEEFHQGGLQIESDVFYGLYSINPDSGETTLIGEIGFPDCDGLDFHPITGELFAVCIDDSLDDLVLVKVNPDTGQGGLVGPLNRPEPFFGIAGISFRSDGVLFALVGSKSQNVVGTIDTGTGNFSEIGDPDLMNTNGGFAFSALDVLFYAGFGPITDNDLFVINQTIGSADFDITLEFDQIGRNFIRSLDTNLEDGVMFIVYSPFGLDITTLGTLDTDSGFVRAVGPTSNFSMSAIAFRPPVVRNIPALSEYGLILAGVVLLAAALVFLKRRRSQAV